MEPTDEETDLWIALNRSQRAIYRAIDSALKTQGLPPLRWYDVLWELDRTKQKGLRPFEIERMHLFEQSNLSRLLQRLVEEGLVAELAHPEDGRGKVLHITKQGRQMRKRMWAVYGPRIHQHMSQVANADELNNASSTLKKLID